MDYYVLLPGDEDSAAINDSNHLGTQSFQVFWAGEGLKALMNISEKHPDVLPEVRIKTSTGKELTIDEFMSEIDSLQIRINN